MGADDYNHDMYEAITELVDEGEIEKNSKAHGIAKQVIDRGYESLSDAQKYVFDKEVVPALRRHGEELETIRLQNKD